MISMHKYIILIIGLLLAQHSFAQWNKTKNTYVVNISTPNQTIRAEVLDEKSTLKPDEALSYYWFASNKITVTKGGYDGKLLHGQYTSFYLNSNLMEKGEFKNGVKNNRWVIWYDNGNIKEISNWKKGVQCGTFKTYNELGEQTFEANFKNGKLNGKLKKFQLGKVVSEQNYKDNQEIIQKEKKKAKAIDPLKDSKSPQDSTSKRKEMERKTLEKKSMEEKKLAEKKAAAEKNKLSKELELKKKAAKKKLEEEAEKKKAAEKKQKN
jgi:hypothetical protein